MFGASVVSPSEGLDSKGGVCFDDATSAAYRVVITPARLVWVDTEFLNRSCCRLIGKSGDKFCTKRVGAGGSMCGTRSHTKKAELKVDHIYFWEPQKNLGCTYPTLDMCVPLAASRLHLGVVWGGAELLRSNLKN